MQAVSKKQQRLMGMVHQCKKTDECCSDQVNKKAKSMNDMEAKDFAETKHKNLPNQVATESLTFREFLMMEADND